MRRWLPWLVLGGLIFFSRSQPKRSKQVTTSAPRVAPEERRAIVDALAELGWPTQEMLAVINIESGWRAGALNPSSFAAGLIQLTPANLARLGFRGDLPRRERGIAFAQLSALEQLPFILAFFKGLPGKWRLPGDSYVAVAASGYIGAPDDRVIYPQGSAAWNLNPGWRPADGGDITAGSIRALLLRRMQASRA